MNSIVADPIAAAAFITVVQKEWIIAWRKNQDYFHSKDLIISLLATYTQTLQIEKSHNIKKDNTTHC